MRMPESGPGLLSVPGDAEYVLFRVYDTKLCAARVLQELLILWR